MVNRWEKMERATDFIFSGFTITVDGECSHDIKNACSLEKSYVKHKTILKNRAKVHIVKAMVFPVVCMDVRDGSYIKKAKG